MADAKKNRGKDKESSQGAGIVKNTKKFQQWAKEAGFSPSFPHDFIPKWPLTRLERIRELDFLSQHYNKVGQEKNIDAAILWHRQFPPNEIIPDEIVIFQDGKMVKESELQLEGGAIWEEEPPSDDFHDQPWTGYLA